MNDEPLTGYTVLVTRSKRQAPALKRLIENAGGETFVLPLIETVPVKERWEEHVDTLKHATFDWIVFTSANAVRFFYDAWKESGKALPTNVKIAAIGSKTAQKVARLGWPIHVTPSEFVAEELADVLVKHVTRGETVLFPRSALARHVIRPALEDIGASVIDMPIYTSAPVVENKATLRKWIQEGVLDVLTFTSPSTVKAFVSFIQEIEREKWQQLRTVCIGPITEREAAHHGFQHIILAKPYTLEGMVQALISHVNKEGT